MHRIIVFQDKLGISDAYEKPWESMLFKAGLFGKDFSFYRAKSYRNFPQNELLVVHPPRKTPGFNDKPEFMARHYKWFCDQVKIHRATVALVMDPALLYLVNANWKQATCEILRGGIYEVPVHDNKTVMFFVTVPIHSINRSVKQRDIAALNDGYTDKEDWEQTFIEDRPDSTPQDDEDDEDADELGAFWYAPLSIPYGQFCFQADMFKLGRILRALDKSKEQAIES